MKKLLLKFADKVGLTAKIPRKGIADFVVRHRTSGKTLDIGSGGGPYRSHYPSRVSIDIEASPGVDYVADAHDLSMFSDDEFDCILCTEVLEHLYDPQKAIGEMHRVLKKGGKVVLTTRFIFPLHNTPHDYWRFTRYGLEHLFSEFSSVEITEETGTLGTLAVLYERLGFQTVLMHLKILNIFWITLSKLTFICRSLITKEFGDVTHAHEERPIMTSGYYVYAVK
ncbi:MAG: methyltransferase domain-containing protein [bacterium]|nr:methyltransferase domain-containing protein [bacterium]